MALEQISQAVLDTARTEADHILKAAQLAAEKKAQSGREAAEAEGARRYQAAQRAIEEEYARKLIQIKGAANKESLEKKNALLRKVFDRAREDILGLPAQEYAAIMRALLERAAENRGGAVRAHPDDAPLFEQLLRDFNAGREAALHARLDTAHPLPERGGLVFVSETFEVDQTLRTLLTDVEYELAPAIATEVFGA
ncbi:MAG TPA: V-type ATP synthase subunit E family protein [Candidatus Hydrogenedentes bacterium]|nr:V-type ATP synthase subunit E family protein [Candidatus Hydrogenedentota bacterium]HNT87498.1 V-type ATP synthase subunit E family protein [Candidatus Hydrogenedentota bacterium]